MDAIKLDDSDGAEALPICRSKRKWTADRYRDVAMIALRYFSDGVPVSTGDMETDRRSMDHVRNVSSVSRMVAPGGIVRLSGFAYWMFMSLSALVALAGLLGVMQGNVTLPQNLPRNVEECLEMTILLSWGLSVLLLVLPSSMKAFWARLGTPPQEGVA